MIRDVVIACAVLAVFAVIGLWLVLREPEVTRSATQIESTSKVPEQAESETAALQPTVSLPATPVPVTEAAEPEKTEVVREPAPAVPAETTTEDARPERVEIAITGVTVDDVGVLAPNLPLIATVYFYDAGTTMDEIELARASYKRHWKRAFNVHGASDHNGSFHLSYKGEIGEGEFHRVDVVAGKDTGREVSTGLIADYEGLTIVAPRESSISGRLVSEQGEMIPDVAVRLYTSVKSGQYRTTLADGEFRFDSVPPGETTLYFENLNFDVDEATRVIQLKPGEQLELETIVLRPVTRAVLRLSLAGMQPAEHGYVSASFDFYDGAELVFTAAGMGMYKDGAYRVVVALDGLEAGEYRVKVRPVSTWFFAAGDYEDVEMFVQITERVENDLGSAMLPRRR